jgi:hypothetical protein
VLKIVAFEVQFGNEAGVEVGLMLVVQNVFLEGFRDGAIVELALGAPEIFEGLVLHLLFLGKELKDVILLVLKRL